MRLIGGGEEAEARPEIHRARDEGTLLAATLAERGCRATIDLGLFLLCGCCVLGEGGAFVVVRLHRGSVRERLRDGPCVVIAVTTVGRRGSCFLLLSFLVFFHLLLLLVWFGVYNAVVVSRWKDDPSIVAIGTNDPLICCCCREGRRRCGGGGIFRRWLLLQVKRDGLVVGVSR